ncbi:MAG: hypothetical protein ABW087_18045 [Candidatus Thiodiazotropha sp.]
MHRRTFLHILGLGAVSFGIDTQECRDAQDAKRDIPVPLSPSLVTTAY